jgi:hypothetical protein
MARAGAAGDPDGVGAEGVAVTKVSLWDLSTMPFQGQCPKCTTHCFLYYREDNVEDFLEQHYLEECPTAAIQRIEGLLRTLVEAQQNGNPPAGEG